jgi:hypothetical protein
MEGLHIQGLKRIYSDPTLPDGNDVSLPVENDPTCLDGNISCICYVHLDLCIYCCTAFIPGVQI